MYTDSDIRATVLDFLSENLGESDVESLPGDTNLIANGTLDSMSVMRLIAHLESKLSIKIPPRDLVPKNFMTLDAMVAYLGSKNETSHPR